MAAAADLEFNEWARRWMELAKFSGKRLPDDDGCLDVLAMSSAKAEGYATCGSYTLDELADLYATSPDMDSVSRAVAQELGGDDETFQGCVGVLEKFGPG